MRKIRILLADEHYIVRRGLRCLLEQQDGWEVCDEAASGREAVEKTARLTPDLLIMDITLPELNGLEAARQICMKAPSTKVLLVTAHDPEFLFIEVRRADAWGLVLKSHAGSDLARAVEAAVRRKRFLTSRPTEALRNAQVPSADSSGPTGPAAPSLSRREREIVQLLAEGSSSKEVAGLLGISVNTVGTHRANIMRKLSVHSLGQLICHAVRNKITSG